MKREIQFADLHCHPHSRAYNTYRNRRNRDTTKYNPWTIILSNIANQEKGKRAFSYSQCDMARLINGEVGIVFASLYPFEKGFFRGGGKVDSKWIVEVAGILQRIPVLGTVAMAYLRHKLRPVVSSEEGFLSAKDYLQNLLMKMPGERIEFIQSPAYDYYNELKEEYNFLVSAHNVAMETTTEASWLKKTAFNLFSGQKEDASHKAKGTYFIARNNSEVEQAINDGKLVFIVTIEGMHSFGTDTALPDIYKRIMEIKQWTFPVFFITFSHHFNNYLCGHAHSLPGEGTLFAAQHDGMNAPFDGGPAYTNSKGMAAIRLLLSVGPDNVKNEAMYGRRILIDVKHMAASSRKGYYDLVNRCNANGDNIPVIASHVGYTGVKKMDDLINNVDTETDTYQAVPELNPWNINVCDEDIEIIVKTKGLLGLCFDQRVLGIRKKENRPGKQIIWKNLLGFIHAAVHSTALTQGEKPGIWKSLCIGTDFEGYIDPVNEYATALHFKQFKADLRSAIQTEIFDRNLSASYFIPNGKTADDLAHDVCIGNVLDFLKRNF